MAPALGQVLVGSGCDDVGILLFRYFLAWRSRANRQVDPPHKFSPNWPIVACQDTERSGGVTRLKICRHAVWVHVTSAGRTRRMRKLADASKLRLGSLSSYALFVVARWAGQCTAQKTVLSSLPAAVSLRFQPTQRFMCKLWCVSPC
eukprot:SAG31_NODE_285_length_18479_cov_9.871980_21_plen_147_part_00